MTLQEEMKVGDHVKWRASIGHGLDWHMLGLLLQELFQELAQPQKHCEEKGKVWEKGARWARAL